MLVHKLLCRIFRYIHPMKLTRRQYKKIELIPGWLDYQNAELMYELVSNPKILGGGNVLEVGSFFGKSATCLAYGLRKGETLTVVDPFGTFKFELDKGAETADQNVLFRNLTEKKFKNFYSFSHRNLPTIYVGLSRNILPGLQEKFKTIHIDGGHSYEDVKNDIALSLNLLSEKGLIIFDDYNHVQFPGVKIAVDEAIKSGQLSPVIYLGKLYASRPKFAPDLVSNIVNHLNGFKVVKKSRLDLFTPELELTVKYREPKSYSYLTRRILTAFLSRY